MLGTNPLLPTMSWGKISVDFGSNIVNISFGGLNLIEYYSSIFGFDYKKYVLLRKLFSLIKFA